MKNKTKEEIRENIHINWMLILFLIVLMICSTVIYLNHNAWTMRFEMDDNTKEAVESLDLNDLPICGWDEALAVYLEEVLCIKIHHAGYFQEFIDKTRLEDA